MQPAGTVPDATADGTVDVGGTAQGIWHGYIDRKLFDGAYTVTAAFYTRQCPLVTPALTVTHALLPDGQYGSEAETTYRYYRFTYLYDDGVQETLLSDPYAVKFENLTWMKMQFSVDTDTLNPRITGINIYRSTDPEGIYKHVQTVDFLRPATSITAGTSGAYAGAKYVYIPELAGYVFSSARSYYISTSAGRINLTETLDGDGKTMFAYTNVSMPANTEIWNGAWSLLDDLTGIPPIPDDSGESGLFLGQYMVIVGTDIGVNRISGGVLTYVKSHGAYSGSPVTEQRIVDYTYRKAIHFMGATTLDYTSGGDDAWSVVDPGKGLFTVAVHSGDSTLYDFTFYDTGGLSEGGEHFLPLEKSITINGEFAVMVDGPLIQAGVVLDPGGTYEEHHPDWVSYSERGMLDVNPVSHVRPVYSRDGGDFTGLEVVNGNPVILKPLSIITWVMRQNTDKPENWYLVEAAHSVGNIAKKGAIVVKDTLYVVAYDGIYQLRPNNLAESDQTPIDKLRVSEPIGDVYGALTLAQKQAIVSAYDPYMEEIIFTFGTEVWRLNVDSGDWREETTAATITLMDRDQEARPLVYNSATRKLHSPSAHESVAVSMRSKTFLLSGERRTVIRRILETYSSAGALTCTVLSEDNVESGDITPGGSYYVDGLDTVVYGGVTYAAGATFTGLIGQKTYTATGIGAVVEVTAQAIPAQVRLKQYAHAPRHRAKTFSIEVSGAASTTETEIHGISIETD
jgi:hypothetical protein